jgi:tetratricopeptide (TPR) repeat protein
MFRIERFLGPLALILPFCFATGFTQQAPPKKPPGLVRDTGVAEGKADVETVIKKEYSPLLAEKSLKVGDFYYKRGNYDAAIPRYQDAIEFQPNLFAAYDALGRTYEKKGDKDRALAVYKDYIAKYPDSSKATEFKSRSAKLEKSK